MKNLRRKNKRRAKPLLEAEKKENGVTNLTSRDDNELDWLRKRAMYASLVLIFFFAVIVSRLWYLQIQVGERYRDLADSNRVRYLEVAAPRGNILDRYGREIVTNRPSFNVVWIREDNTINDEWLKKITAALNVEPSQILEKVRKMAHEPGHLPVRLAEDIDWETVAHIENNRMNLPGIKIEVVPLRVYHYGNLASHLIGYLGEIDKKELEASEPGLVQRRRPGW